MSQVRYAVYLVRWTMWLNRDDENPKRNLTPVFCVSFMFTLFMVLPAVRNSAITVVPPKKVATSQGETPAIFLKLFLWSGSIAELSHVHAIWWGGVPGLACPPGFICVYIIYIYIYMHTYIHIYRERERDLYINTNIYTHMQIWFKPDLSSPSWQAILEIAYITFTIYIYIYVHIHTVNRYVCNIYLPHQ